MEIFLLLLLLCYCVIFWYLDECSTKYELKLARKRLFDSWTLFKPKLYMYIAMEIWISLVVCCRQNRPTKTIGQMLYLAVYRNNYVLLLARRCCCMYHILYILGYCIRQTLEYWSSIIVRSFWEWIYLLELRCCCWEVINRSITRIGGPMKMDAAVLLMARELFKLQRDDGRQHQL